MSATKPDDKPDDISLVAARLGPALGALCPYCWASGPHEAAEVDGAPYYCCTACERVWLAREELLDGD